MGNVFDVAAYIIQKTGSQPTFKLHKLLYYCQSWSLVWDESPIFEESIEAWANSPVIPELHKALDSLRELTTIPMGDPSNLSPSEQDTVDKVLEFYGDKTSQWLSDLVHSEDPWKRARQTKSKEISTDSMAVYYGSL